MKASRSTAFAMAIVLLLALLSAWRLWRSPWNASNLDIVPDSVEYAVAADRVATFHGYNLLIDGVEHPPRYPPWFSIGFLAPVLFFARGEIGAAILPVLLLGIVSTVAAFSIGRRLAGEWGGVGAALALLFNPAFVVLSRHVTTEVPALAFGLVGCSLYLRWGERTTGRASEPLWAGLAAAAGFALRSESIAVLLPFGLRILRTERRPARALGLLVLPSILVGAATAFYNARTFGSWHRTGYHYWCPVPYEFPGMVFGVHYVPQNLERLLAVPRIAVFAIGALGSIALIARHRDALGRVLSYFALAAAPGTLLHLLYFYPEARFHLFALALASVIGGAGLGSLAGWAARRRLWPVPLVLALALLLPPREALPPPYRRIVAEAIARETPHDAVIVSGLDPVFLEPYVLRGSSRTIVPASHNIEFASKFVAPRSIVSIDPPPRSVVDHRAPGLLKAGAIDPCPVVATEAPDALARWLRAGRRVFVDQSFLPPDAPLARIVGSSFAVVRNPRLPWLVELRLPP